MPDKKDAIFGSGGNAIVAGLFAVLIGLFGGRGFTSSVLSVVSFTAASYIVTAPVAGPFSCCGTLSAGRRREHKHRVHITT